MSLHTKLPSDLSEVDVIIAGGGSSGCIIAARLADADPNLSILVIERGSDNKAPTIALPALFIANVAPNSTATIFHKGVKEQHLVFARQHQPMLMWPPLGPAFIEAWTRDFQNTPDRPMVLMSFINGFPGDPSAVPPGQYFAITAFSVYPYSRGHIHITGPSPSDPLNFKTGFFADRDGIDIKKHMWTYKTQREIIRRMQTYRGEVAAGHPPFPAESNAACIDIDAPLPGDVKDIEYSAEDDAILEQWLRLNVGTTWHSLGTCKMAPREQGGVVDSKLSVYGVEGLKIQHQFEPQRLA
ncbi:GMC oxidoreductase-domain-containing protein [Bombardia bombarda]|uniref:GMC oxidoreductase-domain-containing protein n=1 Tax=Bombardia bombarda TaxID=252184 RepID=A0AA40BVE4_9PEZI|nr:GMC oxidoreductase-domain-containing protein [Bombardia bombarda]